MTTIPFNFRAVPGIPYFAVSEEGEVFSLRMNRLATISRQKTGYRTVAVGIEGKTKTFYVHRLVAMAFIPIPEEVIAQTDRPEVNHKDGDKDNNCTRNLEWATSKQNSIHALVAGLTAHRKVKARNLNTEEELVLPSYHEAARHFGISQKRLRRHLDSEMAGMHTKDYWVFMYEDTGEWPEIEEDCVIANRWDRSYGIWVGEKDDKRYMSATLHHFCSLAGLKYNTVQPEVRTDGSAYPVCGWSIWYCNLPTKQMLEEVEYKPDFKFREIRRVKMTHVRTGASIEYQSLRNASRVLGIADTTILYALTKKEGRHQDMLFEYVS
jgi:hypothetical protein